ncbi:MAG: ferritin family protein [Clostridiaceae bacterium]|nr:ferritin family protein [Clostridiaceae bacterium]
MDMLDYAINMELEGKEYYEKQAELNKGNMLYVVFTFLANQERIHADILMRRKDNKREVPADNEKLEIKSLFSDLDDFKTEVSVIGKQLDVYRFALEIEEKSIKVYEEMYEKADNEEDKKLLAFLIEQEKAHYEMFNQLETLVRRPEEWIESPEFGLREDY